MDGGRLMATDIQPGAQPEPASAKLLVLRFPADRGGEPSILHVKRLEVRFHLRPRETE